MNCRFVIYYAFLTRNNNELIFNMTFGFSHCMMSALYLEQDISAQLKPPPPSHPNHHHNHIMQWVLSLFWCIYICINRIKYKLWRKEKNIVINGGIYIWSSDLAEPLTCNLLASFTREYSTSDPAPWRQIAVLASSSIESSVQSKKELRQKYRHD